MQGEGTHAVRLGPLVQRQCEEHVGHLRLAIGHPRKRVTVLKIGVLEHDGRTAVCPRRNRHHPRAVRLAECRPESHGELEMPQMVSRESD